MLYIISIDDAEMTDMSRKMYFRRVDVKATENLIAVKLVINLPSDFSQEGEVTLYETSPGDFEHRKMLDEATVPSCHSTCWFELTVGVENMQDNMEFLVEFTHRNREFVQMLNPMMVLYTYMEQPLSTIVKKRLVHHVQSVRSVQSDSASDSDIDSETPQDEQQNDNNVNVPLSELKERDDPCAKHTVHLDYSQLMWLDEDEDITLVTPPYVQFDFCHGHCNTPLQFLPLDDPTEGFDKRARILEVMNRLSENRLTPPPCCLPLTYLANEIIYTTGSEVSLTTIPSVQSCGCRA